MGEEPVERFRPTSGAVTGVLALVVAVAVAVLGVVYLGDGFPLPVVAAALVAAVLVWAAVLRPRVWVTDDELVLRNMLHTAYIPLAAVEQVVVRQVMAVSAGERRYVSPAIGKPRSRSASLGRSAGWGRVATLGPSGPSAPGGRRGEAPYADFVADRISELAANARTRAGVRLRSEEQHALAAAGVRRTRAWPETVGLGLSCLLLLVSLVV